MPPEELPPDALRLRCDPASLGFGTTEEVEPLAGTVGQDRGVGAIDFALDVPTAGYNVFVSGPVGTGRRSTLHRRLADRAAGAPRPPDWVYLHNFGDPQRPLAVSLAPGRGRELRDALRRFVDDARREVPRAFESESYERRRKEALAEFEHEKEAAFGEVRVVAVRQGFSLEMTPSGVMIVPVVEGRPLAPPEFNALPAEVREDFGRRRAVVEAEMERVMRRMREVDRRARERVRALDREVALFAVGHLVDEVAERFAGEAAVGAWLDRVREDVVENLDGFRAAAGAETAEMPPAMRMAMEKGLDAFLGRFEANVFVGSEDGDGAPVVFEPNPTYHSLFGRIEFETTFGSAGTDHRHLRAGAIHRANGGYLVLQATELLTRPFLWDKLKVSLRDHRAALENLGDQFTLFPSVTLQPEPIPLDLKVVLVGPRELHHLLHAVDEDVRDLFRVRADFDVEMPRDGERVRQYAGFVAGRVRDEGLRHFDAAAVARVVEHGSRAAEHQERLSTRFLEIEDLLAEASHWAGVAGSSLVGAEHVDRAVAERRRRSNLLEERLDDMLDEGTLMVDVTGARVGQVNGLSVLESGGYAFGRPARITATAGTGGGELVSIDREAELSGSLHDKGFLTLRGYLEERYGGDHPLSLSASLTFEQSYGPVEGDSAACAELYALLSALSGVPMRQSVGVTGSVNQHGRVQAVGGVNEKVEGFFAVCDRRGLTGDQGVLIPAANARHLMLRDEVVAAARAGSFRVWTAETVDEGLELLTGMPAGEVHDRVASRLAHLATAAKEHRT